jgi:hypothetical protein
MNLQKFWYFTSVLGILILTFYLGFLYGNRERVNDMDDNIQVVGPNLSIKNSLTEMEIREVAGSQDSQNIEVFGQLFFKVETVDEEDQTEILIQMRGVPDEAVQSNGEINVSIPNQLRVATARRSIDGLDYEYTYIGVLILDEPVENQRAGKFSTILESDLSRLERLVLFAEDENIQNVFTDTSPDLPPQVRSRPAPFFWVEL